MNTIPDAKRQARFVMAFLVVVVLFVLNFRMGLVRGDSMEPTYNSGQVVLVRRLNLLGPKLKRNQVVLARKDRDVIIKRIFALPGDVLQGGFPNVLGMSRMNNLLDYYEQSVVQTPNGPVTRFTVPQGFLVLLGDNLRVSEDSRIFGPVPIRDVLGVVVNAPPAPYSPRAQLTGHGLPKFSPGVQ